MINYRMPIRAALFPILFSFLMLIPSMAQNLEDLENLYVDMHNDYVERKIEDAEIEVARDDIIIDLAASEEWDKITQIYSDAISEEKDENDNFAMMKTIIDTFKKMDMEVYDIFLPHYQEILSQHIEYLIDGYKKRAEYYDLASNEGMAIADYEAIISLDESAIIGYELRAEYYINHEKYELAVSDFSKIISFSPESMDVYLKRAEVYGFLDNDERALDDFSKAIALSPQAPEAYIARGNYHAGNMENALALKDYDRAIELAPEAVDGYNARAIFNMAKGRNEEAIADYQKVIELSPNGIDAKKAEMMVQMLQ